MRKIATSLLMAAWVQGCVTPSGGTPPPESAAPPRPSGGGMAVQAEAPGSARLERRACDPKERRERTGRETRPQIEGGVQSDGRPYAAGGCSP